MTATIMNMARIDTRRIVRDLEDICEMLERLDGIDVADVDASTKIKAAAEVSRELLFIHHLLDKAGVDVMEIYHQNRRAR